MLTWSLVGQAAFFVAAGFVAADFFACLIRSESKVLAFCCSAFRVALNSQE
jgi:hypothetical protein